MKRPRRQITANAAPPADGSAPLVTSAETLRSVRAMKVNPLPYLKPEMLVRVLDAFEHGYLREACLLWEKIAERDDVIASVKPKREKDVSQLDRQIVKTGAGPEADAHAEVLADFWDNARCYNSYDRNERGGFRRLVKQMMTAVSFRYAAHHIIWQPRPDGGLRATFEFVPLWQFENRSGTLRYLPGLTAQTGEILADGEWMVTVGDGLMIPCCIGYLAKRSAFNDWLIFSEKFSVPGVLGRTTGRKGTPEGEAMRQAVETFGHDWTAVIYGDDGAHADPIKLVQAQGNPAAMPMPAVIERVDRKFAALYRGADLSTMSAGSGEGTGASLQEKETDILRRDDAEMIAETLEEVSRMVIEWHFGRWVEPLARVELVVPVAEDASKVIQNGLALAAAGANVSLSALMERAGLPVATEPGDRVGKTQDFKTQDPRLEAENAAGADDGAAWAAALSEDLRPLGDALWSAAQAGDAAAVKAALRKISEGLPEYLAAPGFEAEVEGELAEALAGEGETVANAAPQGHEFYGNQWEGRRSWKKTDRPKGTGTPSPGRKLSSIREVLNSAWSNPDSMDWVEYQTIDAAESDRIARRTGEPKDLAGMVRTLRADDSIHVLSDDETKIRVPEDVIEDVARHLAAPLDQVWQKSAKRADRLRSVVVTSRGELVIVEEEQTAQGRLAIKTMHFKTNKPPKA